MKTTTANVIPFKKLRVLKLERDFQNNYKELLSTLSISEIRSEISAFLKELNAKRRVRKSHLLQGKTILKELEARSDQEHSNQISEILKRLEVNFLNNPTL